MITGTFVNVRERNLAGMEASAPAYAILSSWMTTAPFFIGSPRPGMRRSALIPWSLGADDDFGYC